MGRYRIGIDTGGTFTDLTVYDRQEKTITSYKSLTTPWDFTAGCLRVLRKCGAAGSEIESIVHGTTVGINAVLTRQGAVVGLLCTDGFRDLMDKGRGWRPVAATVDPRYLRPHEARPLVPRRLRRGIKERLLADGTPLIPLDEESLEEARAEIRSLKAQGVESIAVAFIHAYKFPQHEQRIRDLMREEFPEILVDLSSEVCPYPKEYGRTCTTVLNAYIQPMLHRYLDSFVNSLSHFNFDSRTQPLWIMGNQGGIISVETAKERPALTLGSGPVGGVLGAKKYAELSGNKNIITFDMGGTSCDVSILTDGQMVFSREFQIEWDIISALPIIEIKSIGAGGGSIGWIDEAGALHVGPQSAGSSPGPACYGRGGAESTVTDAFAVLGIIDPRVPLGGEVTVDVTLAEKAMGRIGGPLGLAPLAAARLIYEISKNNMAEAIREMTVYRGLDPRDYTLLAFGAGGGIQATAIARELGIRRVVVPAHAGAFSAYGLLSADLLFEATQPVMRTLDSLEEEHLVSLYHRLVAECLRQMRAYGYAEERSVLELSFDGWYHGQSWEITTIIPAPQGPGFKEELARSFHRTHHLLRGYQLPDTPITFLTARARTFCPLEEIQLPEIARGGESPPSPALRGYHNVHKGERWEQVPNYRYEELLAGNRIDGLALISADNFTVQLLLGDRCQVDLWGNCIIEVG